MALLAFLLIIFVVAKVRYQPSFDRTPEGDRLVWYKESTFSTDRQFINLSQLYREIFNKH